MKLQLSVRGGLPSSESWTGAEVPLSRCSWPSSCSWLSVGALSSSPCGPLHRAAWAFSHHGHWLPRGSISGNPAEAAMLLCSSLGSHATSFLPDSIGHGVKASYPRAWIPGSEDQLSQPGDGCQILAQELGSSYSIHFLQDGGTFYVCYHLQDCCVVQLQGLGWHPSMCALLSCVTEQPTGEPL